jgi:hypothetical protein
VRLAAAGSLVVSFACADAPAPGRHRGGSGWADALTRASAPLLLSLPLLRAADLALGLGDG